MPATTHSLTYADGTAPKRGDTIQYADQSQFLRQSNPEAREIWVVTRVNDDMVSAKCLDKPTWRQAFYTDMMQIARITK